MSIRACRTWSNTGGGAHPAGRSGCPGRLHPSSQPGQGALRLTNDQGRTAQNVPICVAYTASHDVGKAAQNSGSHLYRSYPKLGVASRHQLRDVIATPAHEKRRKAPGAGHCAAAADEAPRPASMIRCA